jgi:hypothetical protein
MVSITAGTNKNESAAKAGWNEDTFALCHLLDTHSKNPSSTIRNIILYLIIIRGTRGERIQASKR